MSAAIIDTIKEKANLLDQWRAFHRAKYGETDDIPSSDSMGLTKLKRAVINSDTCNHARATRTNINDVIKEVIKEKAELDGKDY